MAIQLNQHLSNWTSTENDHLHEEDLFQDCCIVVNRLQLDVNNKTEQRTEHKTFVLYPTTKAHSSIKKCSYFSKGQFLIQVASVKDSKFSSLPHSLFKLREQSLRWRQLSPWSTALSSHRNIGQIAWVAGNDAVIVKEIGNQFLSSLNINPFSITARAPMYLCRILQFLTMVTLCCKMEVDRSKIKK